MKGKPPSKKELNEAIQAARNTFRKNERITIPWIRQLNVGFLCECFGGKRLQKNAGAPAGCVEAFL